MALIILLACFITIFFSLGAAQLPSAGKKELLLTTVIAFATLVAIITEIFSLFKCFNFSSILFSWSVVLIISLIYLYSKRVALSAFNISLKQKIQSAFSGTTLFEKALLGTTAIILVLILAQGIIYPPNNWDSMTYHLARITSWVSHQSVAYYPTSIVRQLYEPPFAEYLIAHISILSKGDYFSNPVQLFFLMFSVIGLLLIVETFGLNRRYQIITIVLGVTIPEAVLEASSTQNDIVVSFFIIASCYFSLVAVRSGKFRDHLLLGLSVGLAILTKGTAYVYLAPVLLFWGIASLVRLFRTKNYNYLIFLIMVALLTIGINSGQYYRNYNYSKNVLGTDKEEGKSYANQKMNAELFLSSAIKNAGMHLSFMFAKPVAEVSNKAIYKLHSLAGIDINDPDLNYRNDIYQVTNGITDEDGAPNMIHFILIIISLVVLLVSMIKGNRKFIVDALLAIIIIQIVFFCAYLKWQPWVSRLHVPLFLLSIPLICYAASIDSLFRKIVYVLLPVVLTYALLVVFHNSRRPYSGDMFNNRYKNYFINNQVRYPEYDAVYKYLTATNSTHVGLAFGVDDWEYPLFKDCFNRQMDPVYIGIDNISKGLPQTMPMLDVILTTKESGPYIDFNGKRYYNQSAKNKYLFLYK